MKMHTFVPAFPSTDEEPLSTPHSSSSRALWASFTPASRRNRHRLCSSERSGTRMSCYKRRDADLHISGVLLTLLATNSPPARSSRSAVNSTRSQPAKDADAANGPRSSSPHIVADGPKSQRPLFALPRFHAHTPPPTEVSLGVRPSPRTKVHRYRHLVAGEESRQLSRPACRRVSWDGFADLCGSGLARRFSRCG